MGDLIPYARRVDSGPGNGKFPWGAIGLMVVMLAIFVAGSWFLSCL